MSTPAARQASRSVAPCRRPRRRRPSIGRASHRPRALGARRRAPGIDRSARGGSRNQIGSSRRLTPSRSARRRAGAPRPTRSPSTPSGRGRRSRRRASPGRARRAARSSRRVDRRVRRRPARSRSSSSRWRTVPTRQGTHWPHDSSRKNSAMRASASPRSARLVEHHDDAGAERGAGRAASSKVSGRSSGPGRRSAGGAAEQHGLQRPSARHAAGERRAARAASRRTAPRRARAARRAPTGRTAACPVEPAVPVRGPRLAALEQDVEHVDQGLDVVDHGRLAEEADLRRERRLRARLAALAFDRVEERRLLAADVGAGAAADLDVEAEARSGDVVAEQAGAARRVDRACASALSASGYSPRM